MFTVYSPTDHVVPAPQRSKPRFMIWSGAAKEALCLAADVSAHCRDLLHRAFLARQEATNAGRNHPLPGVLHGTSARDGRS